MKKILTLLIVATLPLAAGPTVAIIGDSISLPHPIAEQDAYWYGLAQRYDWHVVNLSVGGSTTATLDERVQRAVEIFKADIVIIALGINDAGQRMPMQQVLINLKRAVRYAHSHGCKVLVGRVDIEALGWHERKYYKYFKVVYKQLELQVGHKAHFFNFMTYELESNPAYFSSPGDHFHPNAAGHALIAIELDKLNRLWKQEG